MATEEICAFRGLPYRYTPSERHRRWESLFPDIKDGAECGSWALFSFLGTVPIHPSIYCCLSGVGSRWQQAKQGGADVPLPSNAFQFLLGDPEAFPGQMWYIISPASSGSTPGSPTSWMFLVGSWMQEASWSDAPTSSTGSFQHGGRGALLLAPATQQRKLISSICICNLFLSVTT